VGRGIKVMIDRLSKRWCEIVDLGGERTAMISGNFGEEDCMGTTGSFPQQKTC
jgi:hypothetical protein